MTTIQLLDWIATIHSDIRKIEVVKTEIIRAYIGISMGFFRTSG